MNPYDPSLEQSSPTARVQAGERGFRQMLALLQSADDLGLVQYFDSFDEMLEGAEDVGYDAPGLRDYLRSIEFVPPAGPNHFAIAVIPPGTKIRGKRMPASTTSIATLADGAGRGVFVILVVPSKPAYREAVRRGGQFQAVVEGAPHILSEADMDEIRQHMRVCPEQFGCAIFMTQMAINAGIEMMALAAGGRS